MNKLWLQFRGGKAFQKIQIDVSSGPELQSKTLFWSRILNRTLRWTKKTLQMSGHEKVGSKSQIFPNDYNESHFFHSETNDICWKLRKIGTTTSRHHPLITQNSMIPAGGRVSLNCSAPLQLHNSMIKPIKNVKFHMKNSIRLQIRQEKGLCEHF